MTPDELHIWAIPLDAPPDVLARRRALLSPDERARADRFVLERVRAHFTAARGAMREILARYLSIEPERVTFRYGPKGKPALEHPTLRFNLAHSGALAMLGVMHGRELGVDVERTRADLDLDGVARRFFAPAEHAQVLAAPDAERAAAFFRCWTRKEAFLKALGDGLARPLDSFEVSVHGPARLVSAERERWTLLDLDAGPGYTAAACVEGAPPRLLALAE